MVSLWNTEPLTVLRHRRSSGQGSGVGWRRPQLWPQPAGPLNSSSRPVGFHPSIQEPGTHPLPHPWAKPPLPHSTAGWIPSGRLGPFLGEHLGKDPSVGFPALESQALVPPAHPALPQTPQAGERGGTAERIPRSTEGEASGSGAVAAQPGGYTHEPGEGHRRQDQQPLHRPPEVHDPPRPLPHRPPAGRLPVTGAGPVVGTPTHPAGLVPHPSNKEHISFLLMACGPGMLWRRRPGKVGSVCGWTSLSQPSPQLPPGERGQPSVIEAQLCCSSLTTGGLSPALSPTEAQTDFSAHLGHLQDASEGVSPPVHSSQSLVTTSLLFSFHVPRTLSP